jgi:hypothetical protein
MHVNESVMADDGLIDQDKIRLVGRMGRDWYTQAFGDALFQVEKPLSRLGIGIDQLPEKIRNSDLLTGNELGRLGNLERLPSEEEMNKMQSSEDIRQILQHHGDRTQELTGLAKARMADGKLDEALRILMLL